MNYKVNVIDFSEDELVLDVVGMPLLMIKELVNKGAYICNNNTDYRLVIKSKNLKNSSFLDVQKIITHSLEESPRISTIPLKDYQNKDVGLYLHRRKIIDASDMGTGKTAKAIIAANSVNGAKYILCPKSLILNWKYEIYKFLGEGINVVVVEKETDIGAENAFYILSYGWLAAHNNVINEIVPMVVVADEAHYIKAVDNWGSPNSKRAAAAISLITKAPYRFLLSGTIVTSHIKDIYNLLVCVDANKITYNKNFYRFGMRFCGGHRVYFGSKEFMDFDGASNLSELHQLLQPYLIRRLKKDIMSNQTKIRQAIPVHIPIRCDPDTRNNGLKKITDFTKYRTQISEAKVSKTIEFAETVLQSEKKLIICCSYKAAVYKVKERFKEKCVCLTGEQSVTERYAVIAAFQSNPEISVLAMTIQAGGVGLNLTAANTLIFNDLSYVPAEHLQAEDRICRMGQNSEICNIYYVYAINNSLDFLVSKILFEKFNNSNNAIDSGALSYDITKELIEMYLKERN